MYMYILIRRCCERLNMSFIVQRNIPICMYLHYYVMYHVKAIATLKFVYLTEEVRTFYPILLKYCCDLALTFQCVNI